MQIIKKFSIIFLEKAYISKMLYMKLTSLRNKRGFYMKKIFYLLISFILLLSVTSCEYDPEVKECDLKHLSVKWTSDIVGLDQMYMFFDKTDIQHSIVEDAERDVEVLKSVIKQLGEMDNSFTENFQTQAQDFLEALDIENNNLFIVKRKAVESTVRYFTYDNAHRLKNYIYIESNEILSEDEYIYYDILIVPKTFGTEFKIVKNN